MPCAGLRPGPRGRSPDRSAANRQPPVVAQSNDLPRPPTAPPTALRSVVAAIRPRVADPFGVSESTERPPPSASRPVRPLRRFEWRDVHQSKAGPPDADSGHFTSRSRHRRDGPPTPTRRRADTAGSWARCPWRYVLGFGVRSGSLNRSARQLRRSRLQRGPVRAGNPSDGLIPKWTNLAFE
jgi:hypothetical protein